MHTEASCAGSRHGRTVAINTEQGQAEAQSTQENVVTGLELMPNNNDGHGRKNDSQFVYAQAQANAHCDNHVLTSDSGQLDQALMAAQGRSSEGSA